MGQSDMLLRRPNHVSEKDKNNEEMILLPNTLFIWQIDIETHDVIVEAITKDDFLSKAIIAFKKNGTPPIRFNLRAWELREGLLFFNDHCYILADLELRRRIVH